MSEGKFHVLFVCTGNTCRSPMAEGILKSHLSRRGIDYITVSSAGISGLDHFPPSAFALEAAKLWGVDISEHRSRQLDRQMIMSADLILAMAPEHVAYIVRNVSDAKKNTFLIKGFPREYSPDQEKVNDPIGGTLEQYNQTYLELDEILRRIENEIIKLANSSRDQSR